MDRNGANMLDGISTKLFEASRVSLTFLFVYVPFCTVFYF